MTHAATPWHIRYPAEDLVHIANAWRTVATVPMPYAPTQADMQEAHATANLLCAAPDMLYALQALAKADFGAGQWGKSAERAALMARAAMAKAVGGAA